MFSAATNLSKEIGNEEAARDTTGTNDTEEDAEVVLIDPDTDSLIDLEETVDDADLDVGEEKKYEDLDDAAEAAASARVKAIDRKMKHFFCFMMIFWSAGVLAVIYMLINQKSLAAKPEKL